MEVIPDTPACVVVGVVDGAFQSLLWIIFVLQKPTLLFNCTFLADYVMFTDISRFFDM